MKFTTLLPLFAALALFVGARGVSASQDPETKSPAQRIEALEREVATLKAELARVQERLGPAGRGLDVDETRAAVESLVTWVGAQAQSAQELERALTLAEEKGFTKGINWESREVLLTGINGFAGSLQRNVPALPAKAAASNGANGAPQRR